jgi:hypothetical protein
MRSADDSYSTHVLSRVGQYFMPPWRQRLVTSKIGLIMPSSTCISVLVSVLVVENKNAQVVGAKGEWSFRLESMDVRRRPIVEAAD